MTLLLLSPYRTPPLLHSAAVQASNRERFANALVQYDWVSNSRGERLRTFITLGEIWQGVNAPTLVLHGAADTMMSRADSEAIAQIVNQVHPGHARYAEIEGMGHDLTMKGKFHEPLVATVMDWMRRRLADR